MIKICFIVILLKIINNRQIFDNEIYLFRCFFYNQNILKLLKYYEENGRYNLYFEYKEFTPLDKYIINKEITEKKIKKFNKELYEKVFSFIKAYNMIPFSFISLHTFGMDLNENVLVSDFGFHKFLIPYEEYSSYFLSNISEANDNLNLYKTNILNYGIVLLKMYCKENITLKDKEIVLPSNKTFSDKFRSFYQNV